MRKRTQAREYALQILYQNDLNPEPIEEEFQSFWEEHPDVPIEIRSFAELLVRGTLEHLGELDKVITRYAENWGLERMAKIDRSILRFATYELLFCPDIPPKVTINEAVNIAKKFSQEDSGKFVNGILDKINHTENPLKIQAPESHTEE
jgi:N utilization substance protein B